jgi:GAF domain-containing protein
MEGSRMDADEFDRALADAVRELNEQPDPPHTLHRLVELVPEFFPGADMGGVSIVRGDHIETPAATTEKLREVDEAQYRMGQGPCRAAIRTEATVQVEDLATDPRWPQWGERMVAEVGIRSSLSFRLFAAPDMTLGALNVYSRRPGGFDRDDVAHGQTLAAMVGVALASSMREEQLATALETRTVIGQATGVVMERYDVDAEVAFNVLRRYSSRQNVKLRDIARQVVDTRRLPATERGTDDERERP